MTKADICQFMAKPKLAWARFARRAQAKFLLRIEAYFREELVRLRTKQELLQDTQGKFPEAVPNVYQKLVGMERTAGVQARGIQNPFNRADREETLSCCP